MRNFIDITNALVEGQSNGWSEISHDLFSQMFWDITKEHWLESDYKDAAERFFIYYQQSQPLVFACTTTDEQSGDIYNTEGSGHRRLGGEVELLNHDNQFISAYLFWEPVVKGDYTVAVQWLVDHVKPFYHEIDADERSREDDD